MTLPQIEGQMIMQTSNRILDDLAKVANGAMSTVVGIKGEVEAMVRQQMERFLADMDLITRDEFEVVKAMAANARAEQEKLEKKVAALEKALAAKPATRQAKPRSALKATAPKATAAKTTAAKTATAKTATARTTASKSAATKTTAAKKPARAATRKPTPKK